RVGQCFVFDGHGANVDLGNPPGLQLQNFTIEAWIRRGSSTAVTFNDGGEGHGHIFGYNQDGYTFYLGNSGYLSLSKTGTTETTANVGITDTNFHHVAVAKAGSNVVFYVDGAAYPAAPYDPGFVFTTSATIGGIGSTYNFYGSVDELAFYDHALTGTEILTVYLAGSGGKCTGPSAPVILIQPTNQTAYIGQSSSLSCLAAGTAPVTYQWSFNGTNLDGATDTFLTITNAQFTNAGTYSLAITNSYGFAISSNASLTVIPPPPCITPAADLISWWRGESNAVDSVSANSGTLVGNVTYGDGRVGHSFVFDGNSANVSVGNPANLRLQDFTIEAWVKRASSSVISLNSPDGGAHLATYGSGGYGFKIASGGFLGLAKVGSAQIISSGSVTDTNFHHVAVAKSGSNVIFYVDGVGYPTAPYNPGFTFTTSFTIGGIGNSYSFFGSIDEPAIYNRALSGLEISNIYAASISGKCIVPVAPTIVAQPQSTTATVNSNVTFSVVAGGSAPLSYQWRFNLTNNIAGATNASLTVSNVQFPSIGGYTVRITNAGGSLISSSAALIVNFAPAVVRIAPTNLMAGRAFTVPVTIVANGNENSLGFSLSFSTTRFAFGGAALGSSASGASLLLNTNSIGSGAVGISVVLPAQSAFTPGTQEVARVTLNSLNLLGSSSATSAVSFADSPILRELLTPQLQSLTAYYSNANVIVTPTVFEGDVSPRTNGNQTISTSDWLQIGQFVARLDAPVSTNEFQRADCAPRASLGDGQLKVTDWVQAGRYLAGSDSLTVVGGPFTEIAPTAPSPSATRQIRISAPSVAAGQAVAVGVTLDSQANENGLGFTLSFDPVEFAFANVTLGSGAAGANWFANTSQLGSGKLGIAIALSPGATFAAGTREVATINFTTAAAGTYPLTFSDQIVTRCVSDALANELPATFANGSVTVLSTNQRPTLAIAKQGTNVVLSWPTWAGDYSLQTAGGGTGLTNTWTNTTPALQTNGAEISTALPITGQPGFFRLAHP
ncbi:MAG: hypothetical protein EPO07_17090, partial [Verrucomicrobia bacterium]